MELAYLCEAAYGSAREVITEHRADNACEQRRWQCAGYWSNGGTGFYGAIYRSDHAGTVVAFRGTDGDVVDWLLNNSMFLAGGEPLQVLEAKQLVLKAGDFRSLFITGHSLGGGLAALAAADLSLPAVTFNAPAVRSPAPALLATLGGPVLAVYGTIFGLLNQLRSAFNRPRIHNIVVNGDPVGDLLRDLQIRFADGNVEEISDRGVCTAPGRSGSPTLCRHEMGTVISALRGRMSSYQPLVL